MIVRTTIINRFRPLKIELTLEERDGYMIIQHELNDRLSRFDFADNALETIQKSYAFYSDKPVVCVKAYDFSYIKIPFARGSGGTTGIRITELNERSHH